VHVTPPFFSQPYNAAFGPPVGRSTIAGSCHSRRFSRRPRPIKVRCHSIEKECRSRQQRQGISVKRINGGVKWPFVIRGHKPSMGRPSPFGRGWSTPVLPARFRHLTPIEAGAWVLATTCPASPSRISPRRIPRGGWLATTRAGQRPTASAWHASQRRARAGRFPRRGSRTGRRWQREPVPSAAW